MKALAKNFTLSLRYVLALAMLYYLAKSEFINFSSLARLTDAWALSLFAVFLFIVGTCVQALRLQILINTRGMALSLFASIKLTFIGIFFNTYLPGGNGGDIVKIYYASKGNPGNRTEVITILLLDRFVGMFALLSLPLLIAPFFIELIASKKTLQWLLAASFGISTSIIIATIVGIKMELEGHPLIIWIEEKGSIGTLIARVLHTVHGYRNHLKQVIVALLVSYCFQLIMLLVSLVIAGIIIPNGISAEMFMLIPMAFPANTIPITPGGLGIGEAAMESLFALCNLEGGAEVSLGWRLAMIASGVIGLLFFLKGEKQFIYSSSSDRPKPEGDAA